MKRETRRRKKATQLFRQLDEEQRGLVNHMFRIITDGKSAVDALVNELGIQVVQAVMYLEREQKGGPDYYPYDSKVQKWASQPGSIYLGDRKVAVEHPRLRGPEGEIALETYQKLKEPSEFSEQLLGRILRGVSTRQYRQTVVGAAEALGLSPSAVSQHVVEVTSQKLQEFKERDWSDFKPLAIFLDTIHRGGEAFLIALGVDLSGQKRVLGFWQGASENHEIAKELLADLERRGLKLSAKILWVTDGGKGLIKVLRERFGKKLIQQRCTIHKDRNIQGHLPKKHRAEAHRRFRVALEQNDYFEAKKLLRELEQWLRGLNESAADSLLEALEDILTLHRLKVPGALRKALHSTNAIESLFSMVRDAEGNLKRYRSSKMSQRWLAAVILHSEPRFRRVQGYGQIRQVMKHIETEHQQIEKSLTAKKK